MRYSVTPHRQAATRLGELRSEYEAKLRNRDPYRAADWIFLRARRRYRLALYVLGFRGAARSLAAR